MKRTFLTLWCLWWWWCNTGVRSFILIPEEIPSILSVLYGSIPPIKKGTDSRIGIGLRLGPNADFQVLFEIGPQLNTQPLGPNTNTTTNSSRKRQTYNQSSSLKQSYNSTNPGERWLNMWKDKHRDKENEVEDMLQTQNDPTKGNFSFVKPLRQLYDAAAKKSNETMS